MFYVLLSVPVTSDSLANYNFVTFGSKSCPHCKALHDFFSSNYQGRYCFFWVEDTESSKLFYKLAVVETNYGLGQYAGAVPQTLVFRDGSLIAIVIGEVTDTRFWDQLILSNATNEVAIYLGSTKSSITIPNESLVSFLTDLEKSIETQTTTQPQTNTAANAPLNLVGVALVTVGIIILALYFIKRRT